jgi:aldehyde dehydrogenase (NAD+)
MIHQNPLSGDLVTSEKTDSTTKQEVMEILRRQKSFFASGKTKEINFRTEHLKKLRNVIVENESYILSALKSDLKCPEGESYGGSIMLLLEEIKLFLKNIKKWARPVTVKTPMMLFKAKSEICYEPYSSVLIIGSWNAPFIVTLLPLIGAVAAVNCFIVKPSELAPHSYCMIKKIITECFNPHHCTVIEGNAHKAQELLREKFDLILYTVSLQAGRIVALEAAKQLTPVILEIGGKSPCVS